MDYGYQLVHDSGEHTGSLKKGYSSMIAVEHKTIDGKEFTYTYSDAGYFIENEDGVRYVDAYDLVEFPHVYAETDEKIPPPPVPPENE